MILIKHMVLNSGCKVATHSRSTGDGDSCAGSLGSTNTWNAELYRVWCTYQTLLSRLYAHFKCGVVWC